MRIQTKHSLPILVGPGLFRFMLAFTVSIYHVASTIFVGPACVYIFFVLSGYWVSRMYEEKYSKLTQPLFAFYSSRFMRLLPTFYFVTCINIIIIYLFYPGLINDYLITASWIEKSEFLFSNLILLGYNSQPLTLIGPAWSLDIEMQFYLLVPLLVWLITRISISMLTLLGAFTGIVIYAIDIHLLKTSFLQYSFYFFTGICLYKLKNGKIGQYKIVSIGIFFLAIIICYLLPTIGPKLANRESVAFATVNYTLPIILIPFISWNVKQKSNGFDRELGDLSYVLYLLHYGFAQIYIYYLNGAGGAIKLTYAIVYLTTTLLGSVLVYRLVDKPINIYRQKRTIKNQKPVIDKFIDDQLVDTAVHIGS